MTKGSECNHCVPGPTVHGVTGVAASRERAFVSALLDLQVRFSDVPRAARLNHTLAAFAVGAMLESRAVMLSAEELCDEVRARRSELVALGAIRK